MPPTLLRALRYCAPESVRMLLRVCGTAAAYAGTGRAVCCGERRKVREGRAKSPHSKPSTLSPTDPRPQQPNSRNAKRETRKAKREAVTGREGGAGDKQVANNLRAIEANSSDIRHLSLR
eukprot:993857-Rhodomonas_salina.1